MISHYAKETLVDNMMTYADLEWSDGNAFRQIGFVPEELSSPLYFSHHVGAMRKISKTQEGALACNSGNLKMRISF